MENFKTALFFLLSLGMAFDKAKANDGVVDFKDYPLLADPLLKIPGLIAAAPAVVSEWKAASAEERAALMSEVKSNFDIADDVLEQKVEAAADMLIAAGKLLA